MDGGIWGLTDKANGNKWPRRHLMNEHRAVNAPLKQINIGSAQCVYVCVCIYCRAS